MSYLPPHPYHIYQLGYWLLILAFGILPFPAVRLLTLPIILLSCIFLFGGMVIAAQGILQDVPWRSWD